MALVMALDLVPNQKKNPLIKILAVDFLLIFKNWFS